MSLNILQPRNCTIAQTLKINIADNGRMVLPRAMRELLGVEQADVVFLSIDGDEVKLQSIQAGVKRAQALYKASAACGFSSDDFLRELRLESERENLKDQKYFDKKKYNYGTGSF